MISPYYRNGSRNTQILNMCSAVRETESSALQVESLKICSKTVEKNPETAKFKQT